MDDTVDRTSATGPLSATLWKFFSLGFVTTLCLNLLVQPSLLADTFSSLLVSIFQAFILPYAILMSMLGWRKKRREQARESNVIQSEGNQFELMIVKLMLSYVSAQVMSTLIADFLLSNHTMMVPMFAFALTYCRLLFSLSPRGKVDIFMRTLTPYWAFVLGAWVAAVFSVTL